MHKIRLLNIMIHFPYEFEFQKGNVHLFSISEFLVSSRESLFFVYIYIIYGFFYIFFGWFMRHLLCVHIVNRKKT